MEVFVHSSVGLKLNQYLCSARNVTADIHLCGNELFGWECLIKQIECTEFHLERDEISSTVLLLYFRFICSACARCFSLEVNCANIS